MKRILIIFYLFSIAINSQTTNNSDFSKTDKVSISKENEIEISRTYGPNNNEIKNYFDFENIAQYNFKISGPRLINKAYVVILKEFINGKLTNTETLFDERNNKFFRTDSTVLSFKIFTKLDSENLKIWIRGKNFGSKKSYFKLQKDNISSYLVKDFVGSSKPIYCSVDEPFYLLATITPYRTKTGAGQYCKVAYSEIDPEKFGEAFDIPHYFLIQMEFIE